MEEQQGPFPQEAFDESEVVTYNYLSDRMMESSFLGRPNKEDLMAKAKIIWDDDAVYINAVYPINMTKERIETMADYIKENLEIILDYEQRKENQNGHETV